jgi:glycosyltransferase involved in cell wall biosynthesis
LDIASGEYITFVDSDDYVHPECYKTAYFWAINDDIDIIQYGLNRIRNEEQKKIKDKSKINKSDSNVLNLEQFLKKSKREYVCFKMIKSNIIKDNNIRFRTDIIISEDACFSFMVFPRAKRFKIIPGKFYNYRARPGSAVANWDHKDYANRQVKIIITQVYYNWKEGGLIKGREHILLDYTFKIMNISSLKNFDDILKIVCKLNTPEVLSKCSNKCKEEIQKLKK